MRGPTQPGVTVLAIAGLVVASIAGRPGAEDEGALLQEARGLFTPLPTAAASDPPATPAQVALGRLLFFDPRWTLDGNVSCVTCHQPALYGTDALPKSIGVQQRLHRRNAPTVLNAAVHFIQHWNGDRRSLEHQVELALVGAISSGHTDVAAVTARIEAIEGYTGPFREAFPGEAQPISASNVGKAVAAYERTLLTPAPFDAYLRGEPGALPPAARAGLRRFVARGCAACHNGVGVGGHMFQKFGVVEEYWKATGSRELDEGRFLVTKDPADRYVFKVPSLRNVTQTPPYFHDGSVATLAEAVRVMGRVQLGVALPDGEVAEILAFLDALTGPLPPAFATAPILPPAAVRR